MRRGAWRGALALAALVMGQGACLQILGGEYEPDLASGGAGGSGTATNGGAGGSGAGTTTTTACEPGMTRACYNGPPGTDGKGPCKGGTQECKADGSSYGPCDGEVLPKLEESCETPEDDNCNGLANEGCDCEPGATQDCYTGPGGTQGVGICKGGKQDCGPDYKWSPCNGETVPGTEDCQTPEDENCNGLVFDDTAAGCVCEPGTTSPCDTGKLGPCASGMHNCDITGKAFGACMDTYTPKFDDCTTPADDDCSGTAISTCTGGPVWVVSGGVASQDHAFAVAVAQSGEIVIGGVTAATMPNAFDVTAGVLLLEKRAANGSMVWKKTPGIGGYAVVRGVALDLVGNVYAVGHFKGTIDFGGGAVVISSGGGANVDVFLTKLDSAGNAQWIKNYGGSGNPRYGYGIAVDGGGNSFITGPFAGSIVFSGACAAGSSAGGTDVFVAKIDAGGTCLWAKSFGDGNDQGANSIAVTPGGDSVYMTGPFAGNVDFGGGSLSAAGGTDVFVAKLAGPNGAHVWSKRHGASGNDNAIGVVLDPQGNAVVTGYFWGSVDFGNGTLSAGSSLYHDVFVAKFAASTGNAVWSKNFGNASQSRSTNRVAIDGAGNIVLNGWFTGGMDLGGGTLTNSDATNSTADLFVAKLSAAGNYLWSARYGDPTEQRTRDVGVDAQGNIYVVGGTQGTLSIGAAGSVTSAGGYDYYVLKLSP